MQVYKAVMNRSVSVAIKSVRNPSMVAKMEFVNEMAMLMNLRHQNVRPDILVEVTLQSLCAKLQGRTVSLICPLLDAVSGHFDASGPMCAL